MELKPRLQITCLLVAGVVLAGSASAAKVYRWVDENGEVHYTQSLPPNFKDQQHDILSGKGIVLSEDLSLTPAPPKAVPKKNKPQELPRDASGMRRAKARYSEQEMQRRMDGFLMLRYGSEREITNAMKVEIKQLTYDRRLLQTTRNSMQNSYRGQIKQAANQQRAGVQVDKKAAQKTTLLQTRLVANGRSLDNLEVLELSIRADYDKQLDRYRSIQEERARESEDG
jgi:hypothetical protein